MKIQYVCGDATKPQGDPDKPKIIAHVCNNKGLWGAGFVLAISKRWKQPEHEFRKKGKQALGVVQFVDVGERVVIANMVSQNGFAFFPGHKVVDYDHLEECLKQVDKKANLIGASVHMPRIGCGLGGGNWSVVEDIIERSMTTDVYVYDLEVK